MGVPLKTMSAYQEHVVAICEQLGLEPSLTKRLVLEPTCVHVTLFKTRDGKKYVDERGALAIEHVTIEIERS